ncbi:YeeE/YedE thiosulfate transporter family protein [Balneolaceae bacterium ANBcel3]|nr:YeeE/YedE thiosulfate transporter family protein [Balneolaceae bacterium ANBcel3]
MTEWLSQPWPWYIAGPLVGLMVPWLLYIGNKPLGISSSLRHTCAACFPGRIAFFQYDWKSEGLWNLIFVVGVFIGGFLGGSLFSNPDPIALSATTVTELRGLGISDFSGFVPSDFFSWSGLTTMPGFIMLVIGGFFVGFGARYAGGCTSGHAISGISNLQLASLVAAIAFFAGGLIVTHFIYPFIF